MIHKYKFFLLTMTFLSILILQIVDASKLPLKDIVITVDPGHGGRDPGTRYHKILEKDLNLELSKVLRDTLLKQGATVHMIREEDEDLSSKWDSGKKRGDLYRRILFIQKVKSDLYLSIHLNWFNNSYHQGAEVLYNPINKKNKILGEKIMESFKKNTYTKRKLITTDLYLYRNTRVPGVLIECGFLSNHNERYLLQTKKYQQKVAEVITDGVIEYINEIKKDTKVP